MNYGCSSGGGCPMEDKRGVFFTWITSINSNVWSNLPFHWQLSRYVLHTHTRKVSVKWLVKSSPTMNIPKSTYEGTEKKKMVSAEQELFSILKWQQPFQTIDLPQSTYESIQKKTDGFQGTRIFRFFMCVKATKVLIPRYCIFHNLPLDLQKIENLFSLFNFHSRILYHAAAT